MKINVTVDEVTEVLLAWAKRGLGYDWKDFEPTGVEFGTRGEATIIISKKYNPNEGAAAQ